MSTIFLSASVPVQGRAHYFETANPFLIQAAVRELIVEVIRNYKIVWGGHPAITPMIWSICEDLGVEYAKSVFLYQSKFFEEMYPAENRQFANVIYTESIPDDRDASLLLMRRAMLSRSDVIAAVFIGGMEGIHEEYKLFKELHPERKALPVPSPGGAALDLARHLNLFDEQGYHDVDFAKLFHTHLTKQRL